MKKLLFTTLMMFSIIASNAQGTWTTGVTESDELKGNDGGPFYMYKVEGEGGFTLWDWNDYVFKIFTEKGGFDVWYRENNGTRFTVIKLGLYTLDGTLTEKLSIEVFADHTHKSAWTSKNALYYPKKKRILKKMIKALKNGDGYVRIICARKGTDDFDLKIMPYQTSEN